MTNPKKKKNFARRFGSLAAALALVIALGAGAGIWQSGHAVASTVSLDVNPSIEIKVNKNEKVLDVVPLNEEARTVIGSMDFERSNLDVTIIAQKPKLAPFREAMQKRLAEVCQLPCDAVSVKFTTTEKLGFTGRGEGIAASAVVLLGKKDGEQ